MAKHRTTAAVLCRLLLLLVVVVAVAHGQQIRYHVSNNARGTPGGDLFDKVGGEGIVRRHLPLATDLVWATLDISDPSRRKIYTDVFVKIEKINVFHPGGFVGLAVLNNITLSPERYPDHDMILGDLPEFIPAILYHEVTHVWQKTMYFGPEVRGVREGTANYVAFLAGYKEQLCGDESSIKWEVQKSRNWYVGYCATAVFFEYLITLNPDFLVNLNSRLLRDPYSDNLFLESLGSYNKTVRELWGDFARKIGSEVPAGPLQPVLDELPYLPRNY